MNFHSDSWLVIPLGRGNAELIISRRVERKLTIYYFENIYNILHTNSLISFTNEFLRIKRWHTTVTEAPSITIILNIGSIRREIPVRTDNRHKKFIAEWDISAVSLLLSSFERSIVMGSIAWKNSNPQNFTFNSFFLSSVINNVKINEYESVFL